jgi:hypothetical protein
MQTVRPIADGETFAVASGTTSDASTWQNDGTVETSGTAEAAASDTTATDIDAGTATATRVRFLRVTETRDTRTIASGDTVSVASGETADSLTVSNAGTLSNAGTYETYDRVTPADIDTATATATRTRALVAPATDIDTNTVALLRVRPLAASATDIDTSTPTLTRARSLVAGAIKDVDTSTTALTRVRSLIVAPSADIDAGTATATRLRSLLATAADTDATTADTFILPTVGVDAPADQIKSLLAQTSGGNWTGDKPTVKHYWDDAQGERGPGASQAPILYVWQPTGSTLDRFSMDGTRFDRGDTVEIQVWSLDEGRAVQVQRDVTDFISEYLDDNAVQTPASDIAPVTEDDFREQNPARKTDHYVMSVEIEIRGLQPTALAE